MSKLMFVYILTNMTNTVLYTGVTNDLQRRVCEHRHGVRDRIAVLMRIGCNTKAPFSY
jgi:predicted GIY-YIG superfamily endonuclease